MSDEPDNVMLVMLRRIETKLDRVIGMSVVETGHALVNRRIDRVEARLERIERRLDLVEPKS